MPLTTCPECEIAMEVKNFEDVLIDTCPSCRGVWLDRGELQKIIAHVRQQEAEQPSAIPTAAAAPPPPPSQAPQHEEYRGKDKHYKKGKKKKKRFGLWDILEELID